MLSYTSKCKVPFLLSYWSVDTDCGPYVDNASRAICKGEPFPNGTLSNQPCPGTTLWEMCDNGVAIKKAVYGIDRAERIKPKQRTANIGSCKYVYLAIYVCSSGGMNLF